MSGFGLDDAGLSAYGLGTPATAPPAPTGQAGSRYIDPVRRDYQQDPTTGQLAQMPSKRQRVLLAVLTELNSAATARGFGARMPTKMGTAFEAEVRQSVRHALRHMTETEKSIRIDAIGVERGRNSRARVTIAWTDIETGETDAVPISLT